MTVYTKREEELMRQAFEEGVQLDFVMLSMLGVKRLAKRLLKYGSLLVKSIMMNILI